MRNKRFSLVLAATLLSFQVAPALAQDEAKGCELHVWPSSGMTLVRQRASESMGRDGGVLPALIKELQESAAAQGDARASATSAENEERILSTARQVDILRTLPLPQMLHLAGHRMIVHDLPLESRVIRSKARYDGSPSSCYADIVLDDVVYSREFAHGRNLKTFFRFRDFGTDDLPRNSFATWLQTKLTVFSIDPPDLSPDALEEIASALRNNAAQFAELLAKRPKPAPNEQIRGK